MTDLATHPEFAATGSFGHLRLGRVEPDQPARLELDPYIAETFEPAPVSVDHYTAVPSWPMYGNDNLGDCTWAAIGHAIQAFATLAGSTKTPADKDIEQGYWETGTPPAATGTAGGATDNGRMEPHVLNYWRHTGVPNETDSIIGYAAVNPKNAERVKFTIANFGLAYVALAMPLTAQTQEIWDYVANAPDGENQPYSWGGHAVVVVGYDADFLYVVTWGAVLKMTWAFWQHYGVASYALISPDMVAKATAAGVNVALIQRVIAQGVPVEPAGGDLPTDPAPATGDQPPTDPAAQSPQDAPPTPSEWACSANPLVLNAVDAVAAKTLYLRTLAENPDLIGAIPANEATAPAE
jgi:hypothetical protein